MTDKSNTEMLLPQAGIPGYIPQPKKNASEDVIGEYKKQVQQLGDKGLKEDKTGLSAKLTYIVALAWAFFQMSTASWLLLDSLYVKAFHLAFALALIYLNLPTLKSELKSRWDLRILLAMKRVTIVDWMIGIVGVIGALYIVIDYAGISERPGMPIGRDLIFGVILIVLMLEATRRVLGPALPIICGAFIAYVFLGPYLPDVVAFKGATLSRFISQITMDTQGIYGVPLHVSATVVFLFVMFGTMLDRAGGGAFFTRLAISGLGQYRGGSVCDGLRTFAARKTGEKVQASYPALSVFCNSVSVKCAGAGKCGETGRDVGETGRFQVHSALFLLLCGICRRYMVQLALSAVRAGAAAFCVGNG